MVWAWMLWSAYALGTRTRLWFGHGCSGQRMLWEHERDYGLGMDALVIVCSWNTNEIMVWAWMLWSAYALGTRTRLWFGHEIMVWAWMLWSAYALGTGTRLCPQGQNVRFVRAHSGTCHLKEHFRSFLAMAQQPISFLRVNKRWSASSRDDVV